MQYYDIFSTVVLYLVSGFFIYQSSLIDNADSTNLPLFLSWFLIFLATLLLIRRLRNKDKNIYSFAGSKKAMIFVAMMIIYVILMNLIGFYVMTAVFLIVSVWLLGYRNIKWLSLITTGTLVVLYLSFNVLFKLQIPTGLLF